VSSRSLLVALLAGLAAVPPAPAFSQSTFPVTLRILTYNLGLLRVLGSDLVPLVQARARLAPSAIADFARESRPDIMLFEEVWNDRDADAIAREVAPLGYSAIQPRIHSMLGLNSGLLLLVRAPLHVVDWKFTPFARTTFTDSFARKGVLEATVEEREAGLRLALVGTHTLAVDTDHGLPRDRGQVAAIEAQVAQILTVLRERSLGGAMPAILLGDFNVGPGYADSVYRRIAEADGLTEAGASPSPESPLITWDPSNPLVKFGKYPNEPPAKIDHVFLSGGDTHAWKVETAQRVFTDPLAGLAIENPGAMSVPAPLSDHYGFLVEATLVPRE